MYRAPTSLFAEATQAGAGRRTISLRCEEPGPGLRGLGLSKIAEQQDRN